MARRRQQREALLYQESASLHLSADSFPGQDAAANGGIAGQGTSSLLASGAWPRGGGGGVHSRTGNLLSTTAGQGAYFLYASCHRLRDWPGGGGGGVCNWTGACFVRLSQLIPGLALRWRRRGAQLDGVFALSPPTLGLAALARRRRQRGMQLDGEFFSPPLATDFGLGQEVAVEGSAAGQVVCPLRLS